jgi:hypothetical protein
MTSIPAVNLDARDAHHRIKNSLRWLSSFFKLTHGTAVATTSDGKPPVVADRDKCASPQFPGLEFQERGIELDDRAVENDDAIRASLIYYKHTWPNRPAVIEGPMAFRLKVWQMAQELGVPIRGPHLLSSNVPVHIDQASKPSAHASARRLRRLDSP